MKITFSLSTDSRAFHDPKQTNPVGVESARILRDLANRFQFWRPTSMAHGHLVDRNGDTVGAWEITP